MPSTGQLKLDQMRAYSKTPEGIAAHKKADDKRKIRRESANKPMKIKPKALLKALSLWR